VETALGPERAIKGGRYSLAFAIKAALDKYLAHIPLARQQRILARHGVVVTPQTLWDQVFTRQTPGINGGGAVPARFDALGDPQSSRCAAGSRLGQLYAIDERAGPDVESKAEIAKAEAVAALAELKSWLWSQAVLKTPSIGKAAAYTIANWERLIRFTSDPQIPLDNNESERAIIGPVVERKNHYGSKSRRNSDRRNAVHARRDRQAAPRGAHPLSRSRARR
jgi:hypothetical protein